MKNSAKKKKNTYRLFSLLKGFVLIVLCGSAVSSVLLLVSGKFVVIPASLNYPRYVVKINQTEAEYKHSRGALFIDSRSVSDFKDERIPRSINIPWKTDPMSAVMNHSEAVKKSAEIVLYDSAECRENLIRMAEYLKSLGYPNSVYIYESGLDMWKSSGGDFEKD